MAFHGFFLDADDAMYAYYSDDDQDAGRDEESEAPPPPLPRRKQATSRRAPLRSVRRRRLATAPGTGLWGGKRRREFMLWRQRCVGERRQAKEKARWSCVRAPPGLLDPIFLDLEIDLGDD